MNVKELESLICKKYKRNYCILLGNGTSAIYLALRALNLKNKLIALPNSSCINIALAIQFSGNFPIYFDIENKNLGLNTMKLNSSEVNYDAIIAVHNYGSICDISFLENFCKKNNIFLVEDACLAQGGFHKDRAVGSFGDLSIFSFGNSKPLDIGHGGALLTDCKELNSRIRNLLKDLPDYSLEFVKVQERISRLHTIVYNKYFSKNLRNHVKIFSKVSKQFSHNFLYKFNPNYSRNLFFGMEDLNKNIDQKRKNWHFLKKYLSKNLDVKVEIHTPPVGSVPWRFNLFTKKRDQILRRIHKKNLNASSWHPPISQFLDNSDLHLQHNNSLYLAKSILNLWINEEFNLDYASKISDIINDELNNK